MRWAMPFSGARKVEPIVQANGRGKKKKRKREKDRKPNLPSFYVITFDAAVNPATWEDRRVGQPGWSACIAVWLKVAVCVKVVGGGRKMEKGEETYSCRLHRWLATVESREHGGAAAMLLPCRLPGRREVP